MIVGEAPSSAGVHIGGYIKDKDYQGDEKPQNALFTFVKEHYKTTPYFTNLMKCGVSQQTKEKKRVFNVRTKNCAEYLLKEIEIINPKVVLCVGAKSRKALEKFKEKRQIKESTKLIPLIHYSNQAGLSLTVKDKKEVIWPLQIGKLPKEKIFELSFFESLNSSGGAL